MLTDMVKFPINPIALPYSSDNCYVTIGAFISQSSLSLLSWGLGHRGPMLDTPLVDITIYLPNRIFTKGFLFF